MNIKEKLKELLKIKRDQFELEYYYYSNYNFDNLYNLLQKVLKDKYFYSYRTKEKIYKFSVSIDYSYQTLNINKIKINLNFPDLYLDISDDLLYIIYEINNNTITNKIKKTIFNNLNYLKNETKEFEETILELSKIENIMNYIANDILNNNDFIKKHKELEQKYNKIKEEIKNDILNKIPEEKILKQLENRIDFELLDIKYYYTNNNNTKKITLSFEDYSFNQITIYIYLYYKTYIPLLKIIYEDEEIKIKQNFKNLKYFKNNNMKTYLNTTLKKYFKKIF